MNAHSPDIAPLTQAATHNAAVLRAVADAESASPLTTPQDVAQAAGAPAKNMARTLAALITEGLLVSADPGYAVTAAGHRALAAIDVWEGRLEPRAGDGSDAPADDDGIHTQLQLTHDRIRANPFNARKRNFEEGPDREALDQLKAQIVAAGAVLQNLVVFPAQGGVYLLAAGERRWRAVGELIAEGLWPADRSLRCLLRHTGTADSAFIALVENSQNPLTTLERARAYMDLVEDTGWSGREAALKTGWDVKSVQQYLQVLRKGDPADIARHEADPETYTWDMLRKSVQEPKATESAGAEDGQQLDIEAAAERAGARYENPPADITPLEILTLVEIAARVKRKQHVGYSHARLFYPADPAFIARFGLNGGGCFFVAELGDGTHHPARHLLGLSSYGEQWLEREGHILPDAPIADSIHYARLKAHLPRENSGTDYETPWLRIDRAQVAAEEAGRAAARGPGPIASGSGTPPAAGPAKAPAGPDTELNPVERVTMFELAHKLADAPDYHDSDGVPMVRCPEYWLDQTASDLKGRGLLVIMHLKASHPFAGLPKAGRDWVAANFPATAHDAGLLDALEIEREALPTPWALGSDGYVTPWLNAGVDKGARGEAPFAPDADEEASDHDRLLDADEGRDEDALDTLVEKVRDALAATRGDDDRWNRTPTAERAAHAVRAVQAGDLVGALHWLTALLDVKIGDPSAALFEAAQGDFTPDGERLGDRLYAASDEVRDLLVRHADPGSKIFSIMEGLYPKWSSALSAYAWAAKQPKADQASDAPLMAIKIGDIVHKGTSSSSFRILERLDDLDHQSSGRMVPRFLAQTIRNGRDYGTPVKVSMTDIYGLVKVGA